MILPRQMFLHISAVFLTTTAALHILSELLADDRVPVVMLKTEALNSPIRQGDDLLVRIWREKVRDCPINSERYVSSLDGRIYDIPDGAGVGGPIGTEYFDYSYTLSALPVGYYSLHSTLLYLCPETTHIVQQPLTSFEVADG